VLVGNGAGGATPLQIFDHRGKGFRDWFIHKYIISNDTYDHRDPVTGAMQPIGLGCECDNHDCLSEPA
jgi:hypothetical protein